jgi:hypothetical protein
VRRGQATAAPQYRRSVPGEAPRVGEVEIERDEATSFYAAHFDERNVRGGAQILLDDRGYVMTSAPK